VTTSSSNASSNSDSDSDSRDVILQRQCRLFAAEPELFFFACISCHVMSCHIILCCVSSVSSPLSLQDCHGLVISHA
jgi:hypothetical protein